MLMPSLGCHPGPFCLTLLFSRMLKLALGYTFFLMQPVPSSWGSVSAVNKD